jgi:hypothetical protein
MFWDIDGKSHSKGEGALMNTEAVKELVAAAERTADFLDRRSYEGDKLRVYVEAVKAEEKPQTCKPHRFVRGLVGSNSGACVACGYDFPDPIHHTGGKS